MTIWIFKTFITHSGRDTFEDWLETQDIDIQEKIRALIRRMSVTKTWDRPYFDKLKGHKYIHEIIIKGKDRQYRPLGCFGPGPQTFTILLGASKKGKIWNPPNAKKTAEKRRKKVFSERRSLGDYNPRT